MKSPILIFLILFSFACFSQSYTEKYNEIQQRYEYYNSYNELVGYKEWDAINEEWRYTDLTQRQQQRKSPYADMQPVNTFNANLTNQVLAAKESKYNSNINLVQNKIDELSRNLTSHPTLHKRFSDAITRFNNQNNKIDYSSAQATNSVINYFIGIYNDLINSISQKQSNNYPVNKKDSKSKYEEADDYYKKGFNYEQNGEIDIAINFYKLAVAKNSNHFESLFALARNFFEKAKNINNEIKQIKNSEDQNVKYTKLYLQRKELNSEIKSLLERAKKLRPGNEEVKQLLKKITDLDTVEKENSNLPSKENSRPIEIREGFRTNKILEFRFNKNSNEYELTKELDTNSELYFGKDYYGFKRGNDPWKYNNWTFSEYNDRTELYMFYDNYGNTVVFDKQLTYIAWYFDREGNQFNQRIIYTGLKKDPTILPKK
ncbi:hypothetical protein JM83_1690 [Gillisia sp. Hel_I_86]|uniref:tetratricopeptide repeat protein n=1 Tax=Gillisia sp. Hel_I_86 TaxID=1249981 RepID=UPI00119B9629|nr:hypothetical protein [Gillisia sp. Hel_I_86]TVZ26703.1 hypothetical protein JM83_1690 [Gillisia sp. Hel_I_86]